MTAAGEASFGTYTLYAFEDPQANEWTIEAYAPRWRLAGRAEFVGARVYSDSGRGYVKSRVTGLKGYYVHVFPEHQRKGLASAMYRFAEKAFGLKVVPGDVQTDEGAAFLAHRKNPRRRSPRARR